jgi:hypothetical protein
MGADQVMVATLVEELVVADAAAEVGLRYHTKIAEEF